MSFEPEFQRPSFLTEDVEEYCEGGFHPVRVGSLFRGRYFMRGKLGWGGCGIVWWAKDSIQERHVAIKILTANASKKFETFKTFYYLSARDNVVPHHPGRNHIVRTVSFASIQGLLTLSRSNCFVASGTRDQMAITYVLC
jgi:hypothetical protein